MRGRVLILIACIFCRASLAVAGSLDHSRIAFHVHSNTAKGVCVPITQGGQAPVGPCSNLGAAARADTPAILYVIAAQADSGQGFSGVSAGIHYSSTLLGLAGDVHWYGCATTTSFDGPDGPWPSEGSGARIDWNVCQIAPPPGFSQEGAFAVIGAIAIYPEGEGWAEIVENALDPAGPGLRVFDCTGTETLLSSASAGKVRFSSSGTEPGYNPCSPASDPTCLASPQAVDFGTVYIPDTRDTTITIWNPGSVSITGAVSIQSVPYYQQQHEFYLRTGVSGFHLDPGAHLDLRIAYIPTTRASHAVLRLGDQCPPVDLIGNGIKGINIVPSSIDFGIIPPDSAVLDSFQVINVSPVHLTFERLTSYEDMPLDCPYFMLPGGVFDLEPGASVYGLARFKSSVAGVHECSAYFGSMDIGLSLKAEIVTACGIEPTDIDFGTVWTDQTVDTTFTLFNSGPSTLYGYFTGSTAGFELLAAPTYTLSPGDSTLVGLRFHSTQLGMKEAELTFLDCASLHCKANVLNASRIEPAALNFGRVPAGGSASLPFQVYNESDHALQGNVRLIGTLTGEIDYRFSVTQGQGPFILQPGDVLAGRVVFRSTSSNHAVGLLDIGLPGSQISLSANEGEELPLSNARLPFHVVPHASSIACPPYTRGRPDPRSIPCSGLVNRGQIQTGYDVYLLAANLDRPTVVGVDFGLAYDGAPQHGIDIFGWTSCAELQYATDGWPNAGSGNLLTWDYTTICANDSLAVGDDFRSVLGMFYVYAYSADVLRVTPRYVALDPGPHFVDCSLASTYIGPTGCGSAVFTPQGSLPGCNPCLGPCPDQGVWCSVLPNVVDFGPVMVGTSVDTVIHVINTSSRELRGVPLFGSAAFSLPEETGQITLTPGTVHDLRVRFHPEFPEAQSTHLELGASCPLVKLTGTGLQPLPEIILRTHASWNHDSHTLEVKVSGPAWEKSRQADIRIYDVQGRVIHQTHLESDATVGSYFWPGRAANGRRAPAGMYYVLVKVSGSGQASTSFLLLP